MQLVKFGDKLLIKLKEGYKEILISDSIVNPKREELIQVEITDSGEIKEVENRCSYVN